MQHNFFRKKFIDKHTNYYKDCDKYIIKIISCTGNILGKKWIYYN